MLLETGKNHKAMSEIKILDKTFVTSIEESKIMQTVEVLAARINSELDGKDPIFVCVLNGAFMFASDLMKLVRIPCEISFMKVASYEGTSSTGRIKELIGLNEDVKGRTVVLIEDIVDTGVTIKDLTAQVRSMGAKEVLCATLIFKPGSCSDDVIPNYIGLYIPDEFIVGYGLDYNGYGRNLRDIYTLKQ